jgi:hypothetical protein
MSQESAAPTRRRPAGLWVFIVIILIPPVVLPLWVPLYNKTDPKLWGFPFFFWFQFALIIFSAIVTALAYVLSLAADRRTGRGDAR